MSSESLSSSENNEQLVGLISSRGINMEARAEHQNTRRYRALYATATGIAVLVLAMVLVWCIHFLGGFSWSSNRQLQFNWHPLLMTLGMVIMSSQSILLYRTGRQGPKKTLKIWHAVIHFTAFIATVIGLVAVFDNHNYSVPPKANLYSMHSWVGLAAVVIFAMQFCIGFFVFLYPGLSKDLRKITMPVHVTFGISIFVTALTATFMGLTEKASWIKDYSSLNSEALLVNFITVLLLIYGLLVLHLVSEPKYKRLALPEEELALAGHSE